MKRIAAALGVALLLTTTSLTPVAAQDAVTIVDVQATDELLATDLIGHPIYNLEDESVGAINNLIFSVEGELRAVIVGVGGFLGIGEKSVAIAIDALDSGLDEIDEFRVVADITREQLDAAEAYQTLADQDLVVEFAPAEPAPAPEPVPAPAPEPAPAPAPEPAPAPAPEPAPAPAPEPAPAPAPEPAPAPAPEPAAPAPAPAPEPAPAPAAAPEPAPAPAPAPEPAAPAGGAAAPAGGGAAAPAGGAPAGGAAAPAGAGAAAPAAGAAEPAAAAAVDVDALVRQGGPLYRSNCQACHGANGEGGAGPALAGYSRLSATGSVATQIVHGGAYMPAFGQLSDEQIAAIGTYIRNSWGNAFGPMTPADVAAVR
ncbi:MAG: c-type cytochrome [Bauldia sp.]